MDLSDFFISLFYTILDTYFIFLLTQSFVVAIVIPDQEVLEPWAKSKKIPGDFKELCNNEVRILHYKALALFNCHHVRNTLCLHYVRNDKCDVSIA